MASQAPLAWVVGILPDGVLPARRRVLRPLPDVGRADRGPWRPRWHQVLVAALAASRAPVALAGGNLLGGVLPAWRRVHGIFLLGRGLSAAPGVLMGQHGRLAGIEHTCET